MSTGAAVGAEGGLAAEQVAARTAVFAGAGEMRARARALDWAATPLGPVDAWPAALRTAVRLMLGAPVATSLWVGPDYTLIYNDAYAPILGVKHPAALGRSGAAVWDELWPALEPQFAQVRTGGPPVFADDALLRMERLAGGRAEDAWFTYALSALSDEDGACLAVYNVAVEVTGRVRADRALAAERARLRALILHMPAPVALTEGPEHRFTLVNDAYKRVSGGGRDVTGLTPATAFPELAGTGIHERFDRVYATGEAWLGRETHVRYDRDGTGIQDTWFDLQFEPVRDADGHVWAVLNLSVDVTAQVLARRAVEAALDAAEADRARLAGVLAAMGDAHIAMDREYRVVAMNSAAERINGRPAAEFLGRTHWEAWPASVGSEIERHYRRVMSTREPAHFETHYDDPGVLDRWLEVDVVPTPDGGLGLFYRDVTARRRADAERERLLADAIAARTEADAARRAAENANQAKSEFLANMSHELRTPLNAIGGYVQLLEMELHGPVTPEQRTALGRVQRAQHRLLALINDVLNFAKLEGGRVEYDLRVVDAREVLAEVAPLVEPQMAAKGLTFGVAFPDGPCLVWADRDKLGQVLVNLLSNATKFTDARDASSGAPGRVLVDVATRDGQTDAVFLRVSDTGRGIARDKQDAIFAPFIQVRTGYASATEGTGLGLAISRDLARGMGGDVRVRSIEGQGSTFTVALRRAPDASEASAPMYDDARGGAPEHPPS